MEENVTLLQLLHGVGTAIHSAPGLQNRWVVAEISDLRGGSGHVYFSLVQKDASGVPLATVRATMWRGTAVALSRRHGARMRELMTNGNEVRLLCSVTFHEKYGLALNVSDIDIDYCRDTTRVQAEIIAALKREGILERNKRLAMPVPVQRVAVISAPGAAGYGDFMNQLSRNPAGIVFYTKLYEAVMQGERVSATVRDAIERIELTADLYDCVVIIRGGGATTDLAGFDDLPLARAVAGCMLPVIVGIGHERDNTVLDFVAHTRVKTPTAAAEWLIAQAEESLSAAYDLATRVSHMVQNRLTGDRRQLDHLEEMVPLLARTRIDSARTRIDTLTSTLPLLVQRRVQEASQRLERVSRIIDSAGRQQVARASARLQNFAPLLRQCAAHRMTRENDRLASLSDKVRLLSPEGVLARGYSITLLPSGRALRDASQAPAGTRLRTVLHKGEILSTSEEQSTQ